MKISLPKASEWSGAENCAINLRTVHSAGVKMCEPVGMPSTVLADAGAATFILDGDNVMTVSADRHDVYVNGSLQGSLPCPLVNVLATGTPGHALLFTQEGAQWFSDGRLQEPAPVGDAHVLTQGADGASLHTDVLIPDLKGDYPRQTEALDADDAAGVTAALAESMRLLIDRAQSSGQFVFPTRVAWRMVDASGQVVYAGSPEVIGQPLDDLMLMFKLQKGDSGLTLATAPALNLTPWSLRAKVEAMASPFWRERATALEIVAWPVKWRVRNDGYTLGHSGGNISLIACASVEITGEECPRVVARIERPLDGVDMDVVAQFDADITEWTPMEGSALTPAAVYRGGALVAYADDALPGTLMLASGQNPLCVRGRHKICGGKIVHICAPVGGGGGWNYGRLHLLVFATDGIYSVSVDSRLTAATSTCINYTGIKRADAVAATPEAVYVATEHGQLLRVVGARCHMVPFPATAVMLAWNADRSELWVVNEYGAAFVMDSDGCVALRSNVYVERVVGQRMVVDQFGALRTLSVEEPAEVEVMWTCRRQEIFRLSVRSACWEIDAAGAAGLMLRLWADNGGASQRLLELKVDGTVNAPISARVICPARAYFTAQIHGKVTPPARFNSLDIQVSQAKLEV